MAFLGIELGIRTMKIGERSQFIVAPELAYGKLGLPNVVPANSEVLFDIQVKDCVLGDAIEQLARNPEQEASEGSQRSSTDDLQLRLKASKQAFKMGNSRYRVRLVSLYLFLPSNRCIKCMVLLLRQLM